MMTVAQILPGGPAPPPRAMHPPPRLASDDGFTDAAVRHYRAQNRHLSRPEGEAGR